MPRSTVLPAEWHPQTAVMLTWPRADGDFAGIFDAVDANFVELACAIAQFAPLIISRENETVGLQQRLIEAGIPPDRLWIYAAASDDVWTRDHGPITVFRDGAPVLLDFRFNGWGGKFCADRDNLITKKLHAAGAFEGCALESVDFVLEGGAIESDGIGTLLTTERCLLAPTRNPDYDKSGIESRLKLMLGADRVLWLKHGDLLGDDTDGHIDTLARFCSADTIAYQACEDTSDPHYALLTGMAQELAGLSRADGQPYRLIPLPLPAPILDADGRRLPAGYANFLIVNGGVLVPTYDDPMDDIAIAQLREAFPDRTIVGVNCRALIHQYGSLHCTTMQIPAFDHRR